MIEDISLKDKHWQATLALVSLGYAWRDHDSSDAAGAAHELVEYFEASWKEMLAKPVRQSNAKYIRELFDNANCLGAKAFIAISIIRELSELGEQVNSIDIDCEYESSYVKIYMRQDLKICCVESLVILISPGFEQSFWTPKGKEKLIASEAIKFIEGALEGKG